VGDPLCAPFAQPSTTASAPQSLVDPATRLPGTFAERRVAILSRTGLKRDALQLYLRAEVELQENNPTAAEASLSRAADLEPRLNEANFLLAEVYRSRSEPDRAIERYRRILANDSRNVIALNNLAYALAVDKQSPTEALQLAERAYQISPVPLVADTLGWVHFLLGDAKAARPFVETALTGAPQNSDVLLHAAFVHDALGESKRALGELTQAERLEPKLSARADVTSLRERLKR
jgi:Tfp pilus assembly protein PilF